MSLYANLLSREENLYSRFRLCRSSSVVFAKKVDVIGFDINESKIELYKTAKTRQMNGDDAVKETSIFFTANETDLKKAKLHCRSPTPVNADRTPNLFPAESASRTVGKILQKAVLSFSNQRYIPALQRKFASQFWKRIGLFAERFCSYSRKNQSRIKFNLKILSKSYPVR